MSISFDPLEALDTSEEEDNGTLELPSCLESLASSAEQLQQLADHMGRNLIPKLLCHSYVSAITNPRDSSKSPTLDQRQKSSTFAELSKDNAVLEAIDTLVETLPFLNELCTFLDRCCSTVEVTLKRSLYHLSKAAERRRIKNETPHVEFQLTADTRIDLILVSLMDISYAIVSLDKVIQSHAPGIFNSLSSLRSICELLLQTEPEELRNSGGDDGLGKLPRARIATLVGYLSNIESTLCNPRGSLFQGFLERLQSRNLPLISTDRRGKGDKSLAEHFEEFMEFFGDHLLDSTGDSIPTGELATNPSLSINQLKLNSLILINLRIIPTRYMTFNPRKLFGLSSLFILYTWLFKKPNKRVIKSVMQTLHHFKTVNMIHLYGSNCYILLSEFLSKHLPKSIVDLRVIRQLYDEDEHSKGLSAEDEFEKFTMKVVPWMMQVEAMSKSNQSEVQADLYKRQLDLIESGLQLAEEINQSIKSSIATHLHNNKPMSKHQLVPLFRLIALLKSIGVTLDKNQLFVHECSISTESFLRNEWRKLMIKVKQRLLAVKCSNPHASDSNSIPTLLAIASRASQLFTDYGQLVLSIGMPMLRASLEADELGHLNKLISLVYPTHMLERLREATNCSYLFWSWTTLGTYYNYAIEEDPCAIDEVHYVHMAINDIPSLFSINSDGDKNLIEKRDTYLERLAIDLMDQFKLDFLDKLCQELEIELRLQTHRELHAEDHNPFRRHLYNFKLIFGQHRRHTTYRLLTQQLSLRIYVEQQINRTCYNLSAIAPNDWCTYDSMSNWARMRYDLHLVDTQLPSQSPDMGLDLLEITRNLALFTARYSYDLTNQMFVEKWSNRQVGSSYEFNPSTRESVMSPTVLRSSGPDIGLKVIQIKHLARSIQAHGYGVLNSAVNCTYQVMKRLVNLFAKQLADDRLRAKLTKEHVAISASKQVGISFDRATKMARKFRVGVTRGQLADSNSSQSITDLDSIRQSITQLGNLLGFMRMLKGGALSCASKTADYLPELDSLSDKMSKLMRAEFDATNSSSRAMIDVQKACENFDQSLADLDEHFSSKSNYFGIVINLFRQSLVSSRKTKVNEEELGKSTMCNSQENCDCLSFFALLVPALTVTYIDYIINCKERASRRSSAQRSSSPFSDDGFPMGIAFLLTVLEQGQSFAKLEWFEGVETKLIGDRRDDELKMKNPKVDESLRQTYEVTTRRLNMLQIEYKALNYTLSSALLFFKSSIPDNGVCNSTSIQ